MCVARGGEDYREDEEGSVRDGKGWFWGRLEEEEEEEEEEG
jgi:hypothetical protein